MKEPSLFLQIISYISYFSVLNYYPQLKQQKFYIRFSIHNYKGQLFSYDAGGLFKLNF